MELVNQLIKNEVTMITHERFNNILNFSEKINKLNGDIVECGVWKGGMSIFLTKVFNNKNIWVCDSYEGCQDGVNEAIYKYDNEKHTKGMYAVSLEEVIQNFKNFEALDEKRVKFLKGYVKDTLKPESCEIKKISLLRIDVDSYSATLEVLDYLYDKVVKNGMIIFDDICITESMDAIKTFFNQKNLKCVYNPLDNSEIDVFSTNNFPCGCYFFKS
jgi:hypothetical protein